MRSAPETAGVAPARLLRLVLILGALTAFAALSIDMYLPAFPALQVDLAASAGEVQGTLAIFFAGLAVGQAVYGPLSDRHGRRIPLLIGIAIYVAASIGAALSSDIAGFAAARLLQALGGCAGMVIARAVVADLFAERDSARIFSFLMLVMGLAPILAPLAGGMLLSAYGWHSIFWALAAFGLGCLAAVWFGLKETLPPERRVFGGLGGAVRAYRRLLGERRFVGFSATGSLAAAGMFAYITGSPFVFMTLHGASPQAYGLLFGTNALGLIVSSQVNARLLRHLSGQRILRVALLVNMLSGLALAAVALSGSGSIVALMVPLFTGIGSLGFILANATAAAMAQAGGNRGAASALIGVMQFGLAAVIGSLVGALQGATAIPMALVIAGTGAAAFVVNRIAAGPPPR